MKKSKYPSSHVGTCSLLLSCRHWAASLPEIRHTGDPRRGHDGPPSAPPHAVAADGDFLELDVL
uniref:Uncharacterized protein n=1 Tax=Arundo donax TaxID=35708 RepID=A0A0A9BDM1_ARUDO